LRLYAKLYQDDDREVQSRIIGERIEINFWPDPSVIGHPAIYHKRCFKEIADTPLQHFACSIDPRGYNMHFDAAGHALALHLNLAEDDQIKKITAFTETVFEEVGADLLPAFWPVILPEDPEWTELRENYSYDFKNKPYHFHNGGIWPVWMGLFGLGMSQIGNQESSERMLSSWMEVEDADSPRFHEYIASDTLKPAGKQRLSYSASGLLFLIQALKHNNH
ncbi:MAG: glycoside hydrolase 100 family protein, partial [Balneolaceae bacterium]|nr:glycoside hydrolase 100 family protein [Balneolaceae bacterium]